MRHRKGLAIALLTSAALAVPTAADAASTAPAAASLTPVVQTAPSADAVTIEILLRVAPQQSSGGGVTPDVVVPGSCETAFRCASRTGTGTGTGQGHVDYGVESLTTPAVDVGGHVGMINQDNQGAAYQSWG